MKPVLAALLAFLAPLRASLFVIFSPAELKHAFAASVGASTLVGFAVAFLTAVGTDAAANPAAGAFGGIVSFALLHLAAKLSHLPATEKSLNNILDRQIVSAYESREEVEATRVDLLDYARLKADWDHAFGPIDHTPHEKTLAAKRAS